MHGFNPLSSRDLKTRAESARGACESGPKSLQPHSRILHSPLFLVPITFGESRSCPGLASTPDQVLCRLTARRPSLIIRCPKLNQVGSPLACAAGRAIAGVGSVTGAPAPASPSRRCSRFFSRRIRKRSRDHRAVVSSVGRGYMSRTDGRCIRPLAMDERRAVTRSPGIA